MNDERIYPIEDELLGSVMAKSMSIADVAKHYHDLLQQHKTIMADITAAESYHQNMLYTEEHLRKMIPQVKQMLLDGLKDEGNGNDTSYSVKHEYLLDATELSKKLTARMFPD